VVKGTRPNSRSHTGNVTADWGDEVGTDSVVWGVLCWVALSKDWVAV